MERINRSEKMEQENELEKLFKKRLELKEEIKRYEYVLSEMEEKFISVMVYVGSSYNLHDFHDPYIKKKMKESLKTKIYLINHDIKKVQKRIAQVVQEEDNKGRQ
jgi:hypothetical protein